MECRFCGCYADDDHLYCQDCGRSFYQVENPSYLYIEDFKKSSQKNISFKLHNWGSQDWKIIEIKSKNLVATDVSGKTVKPDSQMDVVVNLEHLGDNPTTYTAKLRTSILDHELNFDLAFIICRMPGIILEPAGMAKTIRLSAARGFQAICRLRLETKNNETSSYANISGIKFTDNRVNIVPAKSPVENSQSSFDNKETITLVSEDYPHEIKLQFPPEQGQTYQPWTLGYTITADRLKPISGELKVEYVLTPEAPFLGLEDWSEAGLKTHRPHRIGDSPFPINFIPDLEHEFHFWVHYPEVDKNIAEQYDSLWVNRVEAVFDKQKPEIAIKPESSFKLDFKSPNALPRRIIISECDQALEVHGDVEIKVRDCLAQNGEKVYGFPFVLRHLQPREHESMVAIDFGTSNSCITLSVPEYDEYKGRHVSDFTNWLTLPLDEYSEINLDTNIIPTVYHERPSSWERRIGVGAKALSGGLREAKLKVLRQDDGDYWQEICSKYIQETLQRAQKYLLQRGIPGIYFKKAVLTVPTTFVPDQRRRLHEAAQKAMRAVNPEGVEPTLLDFDESMAVLWYALSVERHESLRQVPIFIVYDFGGGTTDVTVAVREAGGNGQVSFRPVIPHGDHNLGGHDVNNWLIDIMRGDRSLSETDLDDKAESIKRLLHHSDQQRNYEYVREKLCGRIRSIFEDLFDDLRRQKLSGGIGLALAGGSSNLHGFPDMVYEVISELINKEGTSQFFIEREMIFRLKEPKRSVSIGAYGYFTNPPVITSLKDYSDRNPFRVLLWLSDPEHIARLKKEKPESLYKFTETEGVSGGMKDHYYFRLIERGDKFPCDCEFDLKDLGFAVPYPSMQPAVYFQLGAAKPQPLTVKPTDLQNVSRIRVRFNAQTELEITQKPTEQT